MNFFSSDLISFWNVRMARLKHQLDLNILITLQKKHICAIQVDQFQILSPLFLQNRVKVPSLYDIPDVKFWPWKDPKELIYVEILINSNLVWAEKQNVHFFTWNFIPNYLTTLTKIWTQCVQMRPIKSVPMAPNNMPEFLNANGTAKIPAPSEHFTICANDPIVLQKNEILLET